MNRLPSWECALVGALAGFGAFIVVVLFVAWALINGLSNDEAERLFAAFPMVNIQIGLTAGGALIGLLWAYTRKFRVHAP